MKWYEWFLLDGIAQRAARARRPSNINIHISVELPDDEDDKASRDKIEDACVSPGDGIYVRDDGVNPPRFFNRFGAETDRNGHIL